MKKTSKIILTLLLIIICFIIFNKAYAVDPTYYAPPNPTGYTNFFGKAGIILGFVRNIGAIVSVLGIAVLGLRYMLGSVEQKANYKETMLPFIIGLAILLMTTTIVTIVQNVATIETNPLPRPTATATPQPTATATPKGEYGGSGGTY